MKHWNHGCGALASGRARSLRREQRMKRNWKRLLSAALALVMVLAMLPVSAMAKDGQGKPEGPDTRPPETWQYTYNYTATSSILKDHTATLTLDKEHAWSQVPSVPSTVTWNGVNSNVISEPAYSDGAWTVRGVGAGNVTLTTSWTETGKFNYGGDYQVTHNVTWTISVSEPSPQDVYVFLEVKHGNDSLKSCTINGVQMSADFKNWVTVGKITGVEGLNDTSKSYSEDEIPQNVITALKSDSFSPKLTNCTFVTSDKIKWQKLHWQNNAAGYDLSGACWHLDGQAQVYQVTYDNGLESGANKTEVDKWYIEGTDYTVAGDPTKWTEGAWTAPGDKAFKGWSTEKDNAEKIVSGSFELTKDTTLYAIWETTYTVTYNGNGNTDGTVPTGTAKYAAGTSVTVLGNTGNLTKTGYTFNGWTVTTDSTTVNAPAISEGKFTMPAANVTLTAKWEPNTNTAYKVEHYKQNLDGTYPETASETEDKTGTTGTTATATAKTYTGFTVDKTVDGTKGSGTIEADGSLVLKLYYTRDTYTVEGKIDNGGTITVTDGSNPQTVAYQGTSKAITFTPASGYKITELKINDEVKEFISDSDGKSYTYPAQEKVTDNITVTVTTAALGNVTITYKADKGGTVSPPNESLNPESDTATGSTATADDGYTFDKWVDSDGQTVGTSATFTPDKDKETNKYVAATYTAKFTPNTYTIAFNANGGSGSMDSITDVKYDETVTLTANGFTNSGYTFNGWNTKANGTGTTYADKAQVKNLTTTNNGTVTLYAQWTASSGTAYKVEHYQQNLVGDDYTKVEADTRTLYGTTGQATAAKAKTYEGFTAKSFEQQDIAADGSTVIKIYYDRNTYTVTYDLNGVIGTAPVDSNSYRYGATATTLAISDAIVAAAAAAGKTFNCWLEAPAYTSGIKATNPGQTFKVNDDITWYAAWDGIPGLSVTKTLTSVNGKDYNGGKVKVGDTLVWTITVTNTGKTELAQITVSEDLDAAGSITVESMPQNADIVDGKIILNNLEVDDVRTITVSYKVLKSDAGKTITNVAHATAYDNDGNGPEGTDVYEVNVKKIEEKVEEKPGLSVEKWVDDDNPKVGDTIEYTIAVENTGNVDLYDVIVADEMEGAAGEIDVNDLPRGVTYNAKKGTFTIAVLDVDEIVEITYTYKILNADWGKTLTNSVTVKSDAKTKYDSVDVEVDDLLIPANSIVRPSLNARDHVAYIIGYVDGTVRPENDITRSEVAAIFFRLLTDDSRAIYWSQYNSYSDVSADAWYNNAVSTLANAGIITGYTDGTFRPDQPITRAEFATIAARFSDVVYGGNATFPDVPATYWAAKYISLAQHLGWVQGMPDGNFYPEKNITRAEAITMINRVLDRDVEQENMLGNMVTWTDNTPDKWYYEAVQEATNSHTYSRSYIYATGQDFFTEIWRAIKENPDWAALEKAWSTANSK